MTAENKIEVAEPKKQIHFGRPMIDDRDRQAVMDVLQGHILTHGPKGHEFEERFSNFVKGGYAVTTSSCMASLHLGAIQFDFGPGDEIIVPSQTHVATVHAIEIVGATPIFVDCELQTGNIDLDLLEAAITDQTKGIVIVHFVGIPVEMDRLCEIADRHNLKIIEDCALAVGSFYKGKHVGLWGDIGCFSFYPVKHITTGEGGMIISKDEKTVEEIAHFRAFSVDRTHQERKIPGVYDVTGVGLNYRMSELQAALGCVQIEKMPEILEKRTANFKTLKEAIEKIDGVSHVLDSPSEDFVNSYYCLTVILDESLRDRRNDIVLNMQEQKVGCSIYYPQPVPRMKYYADRYNTDSIQYKNAAVISDGSIALPVGPHLSVDDMKLVAGGLKNAIEKTS